MNRNLPGSSMKPGHRPVALIISADPTQSALIRKALVEARFEVVETPRGENALLLLGMAAPALVLLDWNLPDMNPLTVTRAIRSRPGYAHLPVVLLGPEINVEDKILALEVGVDYCYDEAIHPRELMARIHSLMRRAMERSSKP